MQTIVLMENRLILTPKQYTSSQTYKRQAQYKCTLDTYVFLVTLYMAIYFRINGRIVFHLDAEDIQRLIATSGTVLYLDIGKEGLSQSAHEIITPPPMISKASLLRTSYRRPIVNSL